MEAKDTVLVGCEVLCLGFEGSDYIACPLSLEAQERCRQRLQYQAGIREVVELLEQNYIPSPSSAFEGSEVMSVDIDKYQAKLKEWEIE